MITADVIKCKIPSDNALKANELYCNVAYPVASADSAAWAAWATAAITLLLAVFALFAWITARNTLAKMEEQIRTQENRAIDERQHAYLVDYVIAIKTMSNSIHDEDADWKSLHVRATDTWMVWSMELLREEQGMYELTGKANAHFRLFGSNLRAEYLDAKTAAESEVLMTIAEGASRESAKAKFDRLEELEDLIYEHGRSTKGYIESLQRWETARSKRPAEYQKLRAKLSSVIMP